MSSPRSFNLEDYKADVQEKIDQNYEIIDVLGEGQTSVAFCVIDKKNKNKKCLKTLSPALIISADREEAGRKLQNEVSILSKLEHRCLPYVYYENVVADLPYYVCTYNPGDTWDRISSDNTTQKIKLRLDHIYYVISSIFDTFEYLHSQKVAHGDFHPKNILVGENIYRDGILVIDFGSSALNNSEQRTADFASIGRTLLIFKQKFLENSSHEQFGLFIEFCNFLISEKAIEWKDAKRRLDFVIDPQYLRTKIDYLFSKKDGSRSYKTIPASSAIAIGQAVQDVIETDAFQRLRGIKQLSFCDWEYPGAVHTRFEHSLGVFGATKSALEFLSRDKVFREVFEPQDTAATLGAALIHDVGHYPFAHVIEHYVSNRFQGAELREKRHSIQHLRFSKDIIIGDASLNAALRSWGKDIGIDILRILNNEAGVLSQILDGPVDCDKIDYLKRDSYHCGLTYGAGFDGTEIISAFRCSNNGSSLLFAIEAVPAIEGFMILQDQMLSNVYWHSNVRAIFAMFNRFLDATVGKDFDKIVSLVQKLTKCSNDYEAIDKCFAPLAAGKKRKEQLLDFIGLHAKPSANKVYRPLATFKSSDTVLQLFRGRNVFQTIVNSNKSGASGPPINWDEVQHLRECFEKAIADRGVAVSVLDVLVDIPWGKSSPRMVDVIDSSRGAEPLPITARCHLNETIFTDPMAFSAPIRIFVSPDVARKIADVTDHIWLAAMNSFYSRTDILRKETSSEFED